MVNGKIARLDDIKRMQDRLMDDIESRLDRLLWNSFQLPHDLVVYDDPQELAPGYNFATDPANPWIQEGSALEYILGDPTLLQQFAHVDKVGNVTWFPGSCTKYMQDIQELQMLFAISFISTGGAPGRAVEYSAMVSSNIPAGPIRNLFWLHGVLALRAVYNKTSHSMDEDKAIFRIPLPQLGLQFLRFIVYLRPLFVEWQHCFRPRMYEDACTALFPGLYRPLTGRDLSLAHANYTESHLGVRFPITVYRQFISYISKFHHRLFSVVKADSGLVETQLGHGNRVDRAHYGGEAKLPAGIDRPLFMEAALASAVLHIIFGHPPQLLEKLFEGHRYSLYLENKISKIIRPPPSLLHTVSEGPEHEVGPSSCQLDFISQAVSAAIVPQLEERFKQALVKSHASIVDLFYPVPSGSHSVAKPTEQVYPHPNLLRQLQQFMPGCSGFKNAEQAIITQLMYERRRNLLYVSPTGWCCCC
jgi:hypothetical protein